MWKIWQRAGQDLSWCPGSPHGKPGPGRPALSDDRYMPGWKAMADTAHRYGAKLFCQLHPAAVQAGRDKVVKAVEDYSRELLAELVDSYAREARRCQLSGVDGVEIHGAHAHEIAQFMSPRYNRRADEYGGDYRGRARYSLEIVRAIKAICGTEYPVVFRISGDEMVERGRKLPETIEIIKLLEEAGIDAVHVSIGMPESEEYMCAPMDIPDGFNTSAAEAVKREVKIPVITVGRITTMEQAEEILEQGKADLTAIGRAQLADPGLVNKYMGGDPAPVRRCIGCNQGCRAATVRKKIRCMQNVRIGNEKALTFAPPSPALEAKKVVIVGAGPAGLEAAAMLAEHGVKNLVIFEQESRPGGKINLAQIPPFKANMEFLTGYRLDVLKRHGVEICLNVRRGRIDDRGRGAGRGDPGHGQLAAHSADPRHRGAGIYTGDQALESGVEPGERIAILGGGLIGCETAEYFASMGRQVEIFEMRDDVAVELTESRRIFMLKRLKELEIPIHTGTRVEEIALPRTDRIGWTGGETADGWI